MVTDHAAADGRAFAGLHCHNPHHAVPGLQVLGHAGDGAAAAHTDHDRVNAVAGCLQNLRPGHPAVIFRVVVVGKVIGKVTIVAGCGIGSHPVQRLAPAAAAYHDAGTQTLQVLPAADRQGIGHHQNAGVPGRGAGDRQRGTETAGTGFYHRHAGTQRAPLGGQGQHGLGHAVLAGAGGAAEIQIGQDTGLQPMPSRKTRQLHHRAFIHILIVALQDPHKRRPPFPKLQNHNPVPHPTAAAPQV